MHGLPRYLTLLRAVRAVLDAIISAGYPASGWRRLRRMIRRGRVIHAVPAAAITSAPAMAAGNNATASDSRSERPGS